MGILKIDNIIVCSLNCEGINHSKDFINNLLTDNACDILCLQETWIIDSNINILGNIHNDFLFLALITRLKFYKVVPKGCFHFTQKIIKLLY